MEIETHHPAPDDLADAIHDRLVEAGQALHPSAMPSFAVSARDEKGALVGAGKGEIAFRSAHLSELWVAEAARGAGLGSRLIEAAEALAREQGCHRLHLETRSSAARRLYERLGYRVFGLLPDYDGAEPFCYLVKDFD